MNFTLDFTQLIKELEVIWLLCLACGLGAIVGFERKNLGTRISFSAYCMIAMGACLFTVISGSLTGSDPTRMTSAIVQGIGFLGAGVIMKDTESDRVRGITTGATIWSVAGIGMAVGFKLYIIAFFATFMIYFLMQTKQYRWVNKNAIDELKQEVEMIKQEVELERSN
jgi:putative Mg2+ transporter-C (MgtC) family protein